MKIIITGILLVLFGAAEIATTASLVNSLGMTKLISLYTVTTLIGAGLLAKQIPIMNKLVRVFKEMDSEGPRKNLEDKRGCEQAKKKSSILRIIILNSFSWLFILIPGLVTDFAGFVLLAIMFNRKTEIENLIK